MKYRRKRNGTLKAGEQLEYLLGQAMPLEYFPLHYRAVRTAVETPKPLSRDIHEIWDTLLLAPFD